MAIDANVHEGHRERIRQRFREQGLKGFAEHEVLELLLTFAIARKDVNPLAHELIAQFGSLSGVLEADARELMRVKGVGEHAASLLTLMPELFGVYQRSAMGEKHEVSNLHQARAFCRSLYFGAHEELVYAICLDKQSRVIHPALLRRGTVDEVAIYPREVVELVVRYHAHAVLLTHNHPSGEARPSQADYETTRRVAAALAAINVPLVDHLILTDTDMYSMNREILSGMGAGSGSQTAWTQGDALCEAADRPQTLSLDVLLQMVEKAR